MTQTEERPETMSLASIDKRIELNKQSGWGLEGGTSAQLQLLALYCQKFQLLPGDEVTLYQGRPYITIDGRVTLMRRHPHYRGHSMRPLSKDEKLQWGYAPDDIVVEATVRTSRNGDISGMGKVSMAERNGTAGGRQNPVARQHPVEMAQKRALSRVERYAFGTDSFVDDQDVDDAVQTVIAERNDPERIAANGAEYDRIFPSESVEVAALPPQPAASPRRTRAQMRARYEQLAPKARELGVEVPSPPGRDSSEEEAERWLKELEDRIQAEEERLLTFGSDSEEQPALEEIG